MNATVLSLSIPSLIWAFVPVLVVITILYRWTPVGGTAVHAMARMLVQLLLIGYVLVYVFETERAITIVLVLTVMMVAASWISIRPLARRTRNLYRNAFLGIAVGGSLTLALVTRLVIDVDPWFMPRYVIPLAGMVYANAMNTVSLAAERFEAEIRASGRYAEARSTALQASMIPLLNTLFAVGLVALPGMMTGQILSGVSPLIAAKYQVVVMCMIFGASGISAAIYLALSRGESAEQDAATG